MLSNVLRTFICAASLAICLAAASNAVPSSASLQVVVVAGLYKAFAWEAVAGSSTVFGKSLPDQHRVVLRRYFDPVLASLIVSNRRCVEDSGEICNLDFDPIFASQDPGAMDLSIDARPGDIVAVEFTYPGNGQRVRLDYHLIKSNGAWRIADIRYLDWSGASLKQMLSDRSHLAP